MLNVIKEVGQTNQPTSGSFFQTLLLLQAVAVFCPEVAYRCESSQAVALGSVDRFLDAIILHLHGLTSPFSSRQWFGTMKTRSPVRPFSIFWPVGRLFFVPERSWIPSQNLGASTERSRWRS